MFHFSRKAFNTQSVSFKIQYWKQIGYLYAVVPRTYEYHLFSPTTLILVNLGSPFIASVVSSSSIFCIPSFFFLMGHIAKEAIYQGSGWWCMTNGFSISPFLTTPSVGRLAEGEIVWPRMIDNAVGDYITEGSRTCKDDIQKWSHKPLYYVWVPSLG